MAGLSLRRYAEHINSIIFHKYNIVVQYFDMRFTYRNVTGAANSKYRFEIFGIVDYLPNNRKEYLIYSEERTSDVAEWNVRIPEIDAELKPGQEENVSGIFPLQNVYRGHDYNDPPYPSTGIAIGIYDTASVSLGSVSYADGVYDNAILLKGLRYIPVNTNDIMGSFISQSYFRFNDYPGINILSESDDENPIKMYYFIPWGVSGYKVVLSTTNGEKDTTFIAGPLVQNNWALAPQSPSPLPNIPWGNPSQSVHLAHIVPNGVSLSSNTGGSIYQVVDFNDYFVRGFTKNSNGTMTGNNASYGSLLSKDTIAFPAGSKYKVTLKIAMPAGEAIPGAKLGIQFGRESSINQAGNVAGPSNDGMQVITLDPGTKDYVVTVIPNQYDKAESPASRIRIIYGNDGSGYGPGGNFIGTIESFEYERV